MHAKEICIKNQVFDYYGNLVKPNKLETKNIVINEKATGYDRGKTITILSLYYHELMGKIKNIKEKKYLMVDDYELNKALDRIKEITDIEIFDNTKILINKDDILPDNITLKRPFF